MCRRAALFRASGVLQVSDTLDVVGCFANSVEDVALLAAAVASRDDWRAVSDEHASPPVIAWTDTPWAERLSPAMIEALKSVVQVCTASGAAVNEIRWPAKFTPLADAQRDRAGVRNVARIGWRV